ncbi:unnamed protein product, partial [Iphiclides podalirius]
MTDNIINLMARILSETFSPTFRLLYLKVVWCSERSAREVQRSRGCPEDEGGGLGCGAGGHRLDGPQTRRRLRRARRSRLTHTAARCIAGFHHTDAIAQSIGGQPEQEVSAFLPPRSAGASGCGRPSRAPFQHDASNSPVRAAGLEPRLLSVQPLSFKSLKPLSFKPLSFKPLSFNSLLELPEFKFRPKTKRYHT